MESNTIFAVLRMILNIILITFFYNIFASPGLISYCYQEPGLDLNQIGSSRRRRSQVSGSSRNYSSLFRQPSLTKLGYSQYIAITSSRDTNTQSLWMAIISHPIPGYPRPAQAKSKHVSHRQLEAILLIPCLMNGVFPDIPFIVHHPLDVIQRVCQPWARLRCFQ